MLPLRAGSTLWTPVASPAPRAVAHSLLPESWQGPVIQYSQLRLCPSEQTLVCGPKQQEQCDPFPKPGDAPPLSYSPSLGPALPETSPPGAPGGHSVQPSLGGSPCPSVDRPPPQEVKA